MQMMVNCCATDEDACTALKMGFPELQSEDPDMNPNFCAMHGNVCSRRVACVARNKHLVLCRGADAAISRAGVLHRGLLTANQNPVQEVEQVDPITECH